MGGYALRVTLLCVPITVDEFHLAGERADAAQRAGADAVEFRFDGVFGSDIDAEGIEQAVRLVRGCALPCVATCRVAGEGGGYSGPEEARAELFEALLCAERAPRWIDIESASWSTSGALRARVGEALRRANAAEQRCALILSTHDFTGRPADLLRRIRLMRDEPLAGVHKVAFRARSLRDNLELFDLLAERERPTIALAMGEFGLPSRVLAPKFGGFLTFAAIDARRHGAGAADHRRPSSAAGSAIGRRTRVYGVVGWPWHSLSPMIHNAGFAHAGFDGCTCPCPCRPSGSTSRRRWSR